MGLVVHHLVHQAETSSCLSWFPCVAYFSHWKYFHSLWMGCWSIVELLPALNTVVLIYKPGGGGGGGVKRYYESALSVIAAENTVNIVTPQPGLKPRLLEPECPNYQGTLALSLLNEIYFLCSCISVYCLLCLKLIFFKESKTLHNSA